jgi:hypothetical protein
LFDVHDAMLPPICTPPPAAGTAGIKSAIASPVAVADLGVPDNDTTIPFDDGWADGLRAYLEYQREVCQAATRRHSDAVRRLLEAELDEVQRLQGPTDSIREFVEARIYSYGADDDRIDHPSDEQGQSAGTYLRVDAGADVLLTAALQLAAIQKAAAASAITAKWLDQLVVALKAKGVHIRWEQIPRGAPRYFVWDAVVRRFDETSEAEYAGSVEPKFTLLGPSDYLVSLHSSVIPVGVYLAIGGHILKKSIRASNQLSYVLLFESEGQGILVCGDAGCVDFVEPATGAYYQTLLDAVNSSKVVQVAHHAGQNSDFYHVLLNSPFAVAATQSYLLVSHAFHDTTRPSYEFEQFAGQLTKLNRPFSLLFTSEPTAAKVASYQGAIHPLQGTGKQNVDDVRLSYGAGAWSVSRHSIQP